MLHINSITIKNFRPYYGIKRFDFGEEDGLSIIMGDNGIGKSSLIRAFKYVLYDEFDNELEFKIKNELNIVAWEEQNFEMYVVLDFTYNNDDYILKRSRTMKANLLQPKSDNDFLSSVMLNQNGKILSNAETERILKNIIPKKISEYILFEGETISRYKKLLDSNQNSEIYKSIRKILGLTVLENSLFDLETQLSIYESEKIKMAKENTSNEKIKKQLSGFNEERKNLLTEQKETKEKLAEAKEQLENSKQILKNNTSISNLMKEKTGYETEIKNAKESIISLKQMVKNKIKQYKSFSKEFVESELKGVPDEIIEIKNNVQSNKFKEEKIKQLEDVYLMEECQYCGNHMGDSERFNIEQKINELQKDLIAVEDERLILLYEHEEKMNALNNLISDVPDLEKTFIKDQELMIQQNLIKIDGFKQSLKTTNEQIESLGGVGDLDEVVRAYSQAETNITIYNNTLDEINKSLGDVQSKIDNVSKKIIADIDLSVIESKINITKTLIKVFKLSIEEFSKKMRIKVQEDATELFKQISENKEYDRLEFDEHYGLKLLDRKNRVVPNISSGYMNLITISLIYGLHKNSTLTGTILLDAPFSVLTEFHRENIISAFQKLSPQVILLVYKDQIDLYKIRKDMQGHLINEYEIYQDRSQVDSSYKTEIRRIEE
jgi:DNA sulfur modification protein DndD